MTKNEAKLLGFQEETSPIYGQHFSNTFCGLPIAILKDVDDNWYLTIDIMSCRVRYYNFAEAQGFLNNLQRHSNG